MESKIINQSISNSILKEKEIELHIKREDLSHPVYGGNKVRKLKYHIEEFRKSEKKAILTFGGAWSNHIHASAGYFKEQDIPCIGIIRGEKPKILSSTLFYAQENGMDLKFISRELYRTKDNPEAILNQLDLSAKEYYIIPEGGGGDFGIEGCKEILNAEDMFFEMVCCAIGTGTTFKGILSSMQKNQKAIGFPALKEIDFLQEEIEFYQNKNALNASFELIPGYHFGGYAKVKPELIQFIQEFYATFKIKLDPVYTGKMMFGLFDLIEKDYFPKGTKILAIHTGGIQGSEGIENRIKEKLYPD